jgi:ABC-type lipoprotein release transport system permease subunit
VGGFFKVTSGSAAPLVSDYQKVLDATLPKVPDLDYVAVRTRGYAKAVSETSSMDIVLSGVDVRKEPDFPQVVRPIEGKLDDLAQPNTILLFQGQADRLKVKVGDVLTLSAPTSRGVNNTVDVRVVVVARNVGILSAFSAFMEVSTLNRLYWINDSTTGALQLYLKKPDAQRAKAVAAELRAHLAQAGWRVMDPEAQPYWMKLMRSVPGEDWTGQKLDVTTAEDEMGQFTQFIRGVQLVSAIVVSVLFVVVLVGIFNTMAIAIRERTREIGTMRAIGMQRRKVLWLFVLETAILGLSGTVAGALLGALAAAGLNAAGIGVAESMQFFLMQEELRFLLVPASMVGQVITFTLVTVVAALPFAFRAARLRPITAMHHIG